jgi:hypothetical protein
MSLLVMPTHILLHHPKQHVTLLGAGNAAASVLLCHILTRGEITSPFSVLLNRRTRVMPPVQDLLQMKHIITHNRTPAVGWLGYGLDDREIVVRLPRGEREFSVLHNIWGPSSLFNIYNGLLPTG